MGYRPAHRLVNRFKTTKETVVSHGGTKTPTTDQRTQSDRVFPTKREPSAEEQKAGGYEVDGPKRPPLPVTPVASNLAYGQKRAPTDGPPGEKHDAAALICDRQFRSHSLHSLRPNGQPISGGRRPPTASACRAAVVCSSPRSRRHRSRSKDGCDWDASRVRVECGGRVADRELRHEMNPLVLNCPRVTAIRPAPRAGLTSARNA